MDFGASWGVPGHLLGRLEASWGRLGHVLARLGGVLGASWRVLERLGTSWPPSSLQDRKKLEKPTKNHQKPPQHKPDLIWNGKRRFLFGCLLSRFVPVSFPFRFLFRSRFVLKNVLGGARPGGPMGPYRAPKFYIHNLFFRFSKNF